jgi:hypothetical protein
MASRNLLALAPSVPRFDPIDGFAVYDGPFNLLGVHYYASVGACARACTPAHRGADLSDHARARAARFALRCSRCDGCHPRARRREAQAVIRLARRAWWDAVPHSVWGPGCSAAARVSAPACCQSRARLRVTAT